MSQYNYQELLQIFETYHRAHQPQGTPDSLYSPIRYINDLGGKRIRPVLLLMAYNLWHEDVNPALPAALGVEYFHNFSLMHDDIMDEAPLRRGHESVHHKFGRNAAILSGDALLIKCFELLLEAGRINNTGASLCAVMSHAAITICEGQQLDMDFEHLPSPSEENYLEMIRKKTACLLGTSLQIGGELAGADKEVCKSLYQIGESMGMGFQIKDDLLDVFGNEHKIGKQKGGDILRGKKNYLFVHTYNSSPENQKHEFIEAYQRASEDGNIASIIELYNKMSVSENADQLQRDFFNHGLQSLSDLKSIDASILESFAQDLLRRDH